MAKSIHRLSELKIRRLTAPGFYADGQGLYLQVTRSSARSWIYRYTLAGKSREMGLGSLSIVGLAEARNAAAEARRLCKAGKDPIEARQLERSQNSASRQAGILFRHCVERYIAAHRASWRNAKHAQQWENTLCTYALPHIGDMPVLLIETSHVLAVLEPIWATKTETANRLRGRIEVILDWAKVQGFRTAENPARWRGHLDKLLPGRSRLAPVVHHSALPYRELPSLIATLATLNGDGAKALMFTILTAARTQEVIGTRVNELDVERLCWNVPAMRMKNNKEHRIPISMEAAAILRATGRLSSPGDIFIFSAGDGVRPLSNMAMLAVLERLGRADITVHGFRSTFRDWAAEETNFDRDVIEMALAHAVSNRVEAAYRRGDLFAKRVTLMEAWGDYCCSELRRRFPQSEFAAA
jgi:integrase